jgi:hypothetical protein
VSGLRIHHYFHFHFHFHHSFHPISRPCIRGCVLFFATIISFTHSVRNPCQPLCLTASLQHLPVSVVVVWREERRTKAIILYFAPKRKGPAKNGWLIEASEMGGATEPIERSTIKHVSSSLLICTMCLIKRSGHVRFAPIMVLRHKIHKMSHTDGEQHEGAGGVGGAFPPSPLLYGEVRNSSTE